MLSQPFLGDRSTQLGLRFLLLVPANQLAFDLLEAAMLQQELSQLFTWVLSRDLELNRTGW